MFTATQEQNSKLDALRERLRSLGAVAVGFSGGVDSTLLLAVAKEQLDDHVIAVTESNSLYPQRETDEACAYCAQLGVPQVVVSHAPATIEGFSANPRNRCYLCKLNLFGHLRQAADEKARQLGIIGPGQRIACVEGSNVTDRGDFRPGAQAVAELGMLSPLDEAGMTKQDIRDLSRQLGLPTWSKPSFACLASRFPYGEPITEELLARVGAAEQLLLDAGFQQVRVRMHGNGTLARIEVLPPAIADALVFLQEGGALQLKELGFKHVSLDAEGYRTGSMN